MVLFCFFANGSVNPEAWHSATAVTRAFNIGRSEASAVAALQTQVAPAVVAILKDSVARRGMRSFITHDCIAAGFFSTGFSSAKGSMDAWTSEMTNTDSLQLVAWLCCSVFQTSPNSFEIHCPLETRMKPLTNFDTFVICSSLKLC